MVSLAEIAAEKLISFFTPPDIRRSYKLNHLMIRLTMSAAAGMQDGRLDKFISANGRKIPIHIFPPKTVGMDPRIIIFYHGGGWVKDSTLSYRRICRQLAEITGSYVVSVDYRLAPEHKFPAGLNDCYLAAKHIYRFAKRLGLSSRSIILAGDSAGGNLAAAVSLMARDRHTFRVRRQILIYPAADCEYGDNTPYPSVRENGKGCILTAERMRGFLELYLNSPEEKDNPYVAPSKAVDLSRMPETLILTSQRDPLRDEGEEFGRRLHKAGNPVMAFRLRGAYHGYFNTDLRRHPHAVKAVSIIKYFLDLTD